MGHIRKEILSVDVEIARISEQIRELETRLRALHDRRKANVEKLVQPSKDARTSIRPNADI